MGETRVAARARVTAEILAAARREIAEHGGGGLSMRAIARNVGLVSSAIYRYFPTREALLTGSSQKRVDHGSEASGVEETAGDVVGEVSEPSGGAAEVLQ